MLGDGLLIYEDALIMFLNTIPTFRKQWANLHLLKNTIIIFSDLSRWQDNRAKGMIH